MNSIDQIPLCQSGRPSVRRLLKERRISGGCRPLGSRVERGETDRMGKKTDAPPCFLPIFHIDIPLYKLQIDKLGRRRDFVNSIFLPCLECSASMQVSENCCQTLVTNQMSQCVTSQREKVRNAMQRNQSRKHTSQEIPEYLELIKLFPRNMTENF